MKDKVVYALFAIWTIWGGIACEDKDYDLIVSSTDDYTSETGGDYYEGGGIDVSLYEKARVFPGLVDTLTEHRISESVINIDMSRRSIIASKVNLTLTPTPIYSTGLYAGAGEKITFVLDDDVKGLTAQIGIQSRDLSSLSEGSYLERDPKIVTSMPLFKGVNELRNPYGGYIWIKRSGEGSDGGRTIPVKIQHAYAAPDFIQGETITAVEEWVEKIKSTTVPWLELRGKHMAFSVPTNYIKLKVQSDGIDFAKRLDNALNLWDDWVLCALEFYGLDGEEPSFPKLGFPVRAVMDAHLITERYSYYSDAYIELLATEELIDMISDPEQIKAGTLNTAHVMAWLQKIMFRQNYFPSSAPNSFNSMYSVMPNFYFLYKNGWWNNQNFNLLSYTISGSNIVNKTDYELKSEAFDRLAEWAMADSCKIYNDEAKRPVKEVYGQELDWPAALAIYSALLSYKQEDTGKDGWKFFGYLNRYLMQESENFYTEGRRSMQDVMLACLTDYFERDFTQLFDRWGIEISDDKRIEALEYPHVEKSIWEYNPLKKNQTSNFDGKVFYTRSGRTPFRHLRTNWSVAAYSGEGSSLKGGNYNHIDQKRTPYALFDGNRGTLWESYYDRYQNYKDDKGVEHFAYYRDSLYYKATTPQLPYSVVVKPSANAIDVDGVYLAFGWKLEGSIFNDDVKRYNGTDNWSEYSFRAQHILVEVTNTPLEYQQTDSTFTNIADIQWKTVYDSKNDPKGSELQQYWPDRFNMFYIDFDQKQTGVTGIRLKMDEVSHYAPERPAFLSEVEYPRRPKEVNRDLDRIHMLAEFGTYYYKE